MRQLHTTATTLVLLACLGVCNLAWAADDALPSHELLLGAGLPAPFTIHGHDPGESDSSVDFIGHALLAYRWRPAPSWNWLALEAQLSGSHMTGSVDAVPGTVTWWTVSPHVAASLAPLRQRPEFIVEAGAGPSLLRNTIYIDRDINKQVHSIGAQFFAALGWQPYDRLRVMARLGVDLYAEPYDEPTWYNQPLGRTDFASFDLVLVVGWGRH